MRSFAVSFGSLYLFLITNSCSALRAAKNADQEFDNLGDFNGRKFLKLLSRGGKDDGDDGNDNNGDDSTRCQRALPRCQAAVGDVDTLPTERWIDMIEGMDLTGNDPHIATLKQIVLDANMPQTEFAGLVESVTEKQNRASMKESMILVAKQMQVVDSLQPKELIQDLTAIVTELGGLFRQGSAEEIIITLIVYSLELSARTFELIKTNPATIDLVIFVLYELAAFISTFTADLFRVAVFDADSQCISDLMKCNYNKMMMNVVPSFVGTVFLVKSISPPVTNKASRAPKT